MSEWIGSVGHYSAQYQQQDEHQQGRMEIWIKPVGKKKCLTPCQPGRLNKLYQGDQRERERGVSQQTEQIRRGRGAQRERERE